MSETPPDSIPDRDHEFRECVEWVEVKPGMVGESLCDSCHIESYSRLPDWADEAFVTPDDD